MQAPSLIIALVLLAFAADVCSRRHSRYHKSRYDERIVGGTNDTVENNPHIVFMLFQDAKKDNYRCGGSIISENYILTAAHCTQGKVKATIRAGSSKANSGAKYTSAEIIRHPSYDVAVIRTTQPIRLDGIKTKIIQLPEQDCDVKSGTNIKVAGWGTTEEGGYLSPNLMSVIVPAITYEECKKKLGQITECHFCAGLPEGGKDACVGDSGGPAVDSASAPSKYSRETCSGQAGKQVGIVSSGVGCARPGKPGVYTKVSCPSVRSWIKLTTGV